MLISSSNQVSLFDLDSELDELTSYQSDQLFSLFNQFTNMDDIIPASFHNAHYPNVGKNRVNRAQYVCPKRTIKSNDCLT